MREAERRRQEQQRASFDQVAIERQMREQMHLEEQAMLNIRDNSTQPRSVELDTKSRVRGVYWGMSDMYRPQ